MLTNWTRRHGRLRLAAAPVTALAISVATLGTTRATEPITIGFGMAETGGLAANGKAALVAMQIWADQTNAHGGLLGRPVKLIYYDDQSNPATVPGLYSKLLDVDKVDLAVSGYGTTQIAPAMPVIIAHKMTFLSLFGLDVNKEFHYDRYFSMAPTGGEHPSQAFSIGFFDLAAQQTPKPTSVALIAANSEFAIHAADGAREQAKARGLKIVYDSTYPPSTTDFGPIIQAIQAAHPDIVFVASYPPDSAGMVRAAHEAGLQTKIFGGGMVGLQFTSFKTQLGPELNGIVNYDFWEPAKTLQFPGVLGFLKVYQAEAEKAGVDPLGYYLPPSAYAYLQVLADAVTATKSLDQEKLAAYLRSHTFSTVVGDVKFGPNGEWAEPRVLEVQFHGIEGNGLDQFKTDAKQTILWPSEYATGKMIYPYTAASQVASGTSAK
jgi:branched-chain amino acid transport system substrate-binding protein